jgi:predicted RNase H-like HicB family nuclease
MEQARRMTAIIQAEDNGFVAICPELDIASDGTSVEDATANLVEALTLFFETADPSEPDRRWHRDIFMTEIEVPAQIEVPVG